MITFIILTCRHKILVVFFPKAHFCESVIDYQLAQIYTRKLSLGYRPQPSATVEALLDRHNRRQGIMVFNNLTLLVW